MEYLYTVHTSAGNVTVVVEPLMLETLSSPINVYMDMITIPHDTSWQHAFLFPTCTRRFLIIQYGTHVLRITVLSIDERGGSIFVGLVFFPGDPVALKSDWYTLMFLSLELIEDRYPFFHVPISNAVAIVRWIQNRTSVFPLQLYSFSIFKYYSSLDTESYIFTSVVGAPSFVLHW